MSAVRPTSTDAAFEELCRRFFPDRQDQIKLGFLRGAIEGTELVLTALVDRVARFVDEPNADFSLHDTVEEAGWVAAELEFAAWELRRFAEHFRAQVDPAGARILRFVNASAKAGEEETGNEGRRR